jgi:hypothetical protein
MHALARHVFAVHAHAKDAHAAHAHFMRAHAVPMPVPCIECFYVSINSDKAKIGLTMSSQLIW